jgi:excisionase family DNA binding protein
MPTEPKFYNAKEAARLLGVNVQTMRRYLREGKIRSIRLGRDWRISQAALEELAGRSQVTPAEPREANQ